MITPGVPIREPGQDVLGRSRFAKNLANALARYSLNDSLVVGLYGAWGTGKSSLLNLVEKALAKEPAPNQPIVIRFNPWHYSDENNLTSQFFDALSNPLSRPDLGSKYNNISALMEKVSTRAKIFEGVPYGVGKAVKAGTWFTRMFAQGLRKEADESHDLDSLKLAITNALQFSERRIVVLIDDIDRLTDREVRHIFQLVKALADFPNIIYVLAFDKDVVTKALAAVQQGSGEAYLEKIVNVPVDLPQASRLQLRTMFAERVNAFAESMRTSERGARYRWDDRRPSELFEAVALHFKTIRAIDRFSNALSVISDLVRDEVDYADFITLTAIQSLAPKLYYLIRENPGLFLDTALSHVLEKRDGDIAAAALLDEQIKDAVKDNSFSADDAKELLKMLFPRLERLYDKRGYSERSQRQWLAERRVCATFEVFETYFQLDVPAGGFSAARMVEILSNLDRDEFKASFQELIDEGKALAFLDELVTSHVDDSNVVAHATDVIAVLFDAGDQLPASMAGFPIRLDGPTLIMQLAYHLPRRLASEQARFECLYEAISHSSRSLYTFVQTISVEDQTHGRYGLGGSGQVEKGNVSSEHLDELEALARSKIEIWANDGRLATHPELAYILFRWRNWDGGNAVVSYVTEHLPDTEFVRLVIRIVVSESARRFNAPATLHGSTIKELAPLNVVRQRLRNIRADAAFMSSLESSAAQAITTLADEPPPQETA